MFRIEVSTGNAAMRDEWDGEDTVSGEAIADILDGVAATLRDGVWMSGRCNDANGNRVGFWEVED